MFYQVNKSKTSTMKKYTIIFEQNKILLNEIVITSDKGLIHLIHHLLIDNVELQEGDIIGIKSEDTDSLIEFLDNNQANDTEETPELTQKEKELAWYEEKQKEELFKMHSHFTQINNNL